MIKFIYLILTDYKYNSIIQIGRSMFKIKLKGEDYLQSEVIINDVRIPIIKESEVIYYPISYMGSKVLLKDLTGNQLIRNGYGEYIRQFEINYGEDTGGIQNTYCISELGLRVILKNSKIGRLKIEQKRAMNKVLEYLDMELIIEDERFIKTINKNKILEYSEYIQDCIDDVLQEDANIIWQRCGKCGNYYPYHVNFFRENPHSGKDYPLYTNCRDCKWTEGRSRDWIRRNSSRLSNLYRIGGIYTYRLYKSNDIIGIYKDWIKKQYYNKLPKELNNKENSLIIIKYLYDIEEITINNLIIKNIAKQYKLFSLEQKVKSNEIYQYLFNDDPINYPWKYPHFLLSQDMEFSQYKKIFNNYIENKNIKIDNIYDFDYFNICKKCGLISYMNSDLLGFVMKYYDNKYPAYKFKIKSINYWKDKNNRIQALKYLIEEDMKTPIEKVPLYLTLTTIRTIPNNYTMYNLLRKYYKNNLWEWVNELYTNKFVEEDFNIGVIRNNFDSAEEHTIHDILYGKFKNVLYNQRNTKNTIRISGMEPDWFVFTDNGVWVVEYFGISIDAKVYNTKIDYYKKKTLKKIGKYESENMKWLGKVYIYPEDLKDNFKGMEEKLKVIV